MKSETFTLNYTSVPHGTDKTELIFYREINDLQDSIKNEIDEISELVIATDDKIAQLENVKPILAYAEKKNASIVIIEAGEKNKKLDNVLAILKGALEKAYSRKCTFIALGGGVISDLCAFACSLYKRGAKLEIIPTTLLSMSDAAIGGKTGCDFENYKNMIGTFYPAGKIHFCADFVQTLSENEYFSGLGEVVKTAMLYDKGLFESLSNDSEKIKKRDREAVFEVIKKCAQAKAKIVEMDITEQNIRRQLNLGHTFAHALESVAGFGVIPHGKAVAWGLSREAHLSLNLGLCSEEYCACVDKVLSHYGYCIDKVPAEVSRVENVAEKLIRAMKQDKKNEGKEIIFVLQEGLCSTVIQNVDESQIYSVLS